MTIEDLFDRCEDAVILDDARCTVNWTKKGYGFGQLYFYYDDDGKLHCVSECCGPKFVKSILDMLVDSAIFDDVADGTYVGKDITQEVWNKERE